MADVTPVNGSINLGRQGENIVTRVLLPLSDIRSGDGYAVLFHQRSVDDSPYPVTVQEDGDTLIWTVTDADTAVAGRGKAEMRWIGSHGELAKSQVYKTYVAAALEIPEEVPSGYQKYVDAVAENAKDAKDAAAESRAIYGQVLNSQRKIDETYNATVAAKVKAEEAREKAESAANGIGTAKDDAAASAETAKGAAIAAKAAKEAAETAQTGAVEAKTGAETAQRKAEEAAQGVAADREQIGANKSGLETAQQELTATKQELSETKAALTTTQEDLKKAQRAIQFQTELSKGQTWDFETDDSVAYSRTVPSGAKAGAVMAVGGKTVVWNQLCNAFPNPGTYKGVKVAVSNGKVSLSGTATDAMLVGVGYAAVTVSGHKYMATGIQGGSKSTFYVQGVNENNGYYNILDATAIFAATGARYRYNIIAVAGTVFNHTFQPMVVDLTLMFGSGNEPADTSDPRIAPIEAYAAAHPEYNAGELLSAKVDEVRAANAAGDSTVTYPIPSAVQSLPGYGWSAGSVANTVERTENGWQYVQRVGSVDLGTLTWMDELGGAGYNRFRCDIKNGMILAESANQPANAICTAYDVITAGLTYRGAVGISCQPTKTVWYVYDDRYGSADEFASAMSGEMLYYELATPITTDITDLMGDSLAPFAVEAGGSITLHHPKADEGFAIDVPANTQYIIKLSEVSSNG